MLSIETLTVKSFDRAHIDIYWNASTTGEDPLQYTVTVERSLNQLSDYVPVGSALIGHSHFRDITPENGMAFHRKVWYRLRLTNRRTGATSLHPAEGGVSTGPPPDLLALEEARLYSVRLRLIDGRPVWLFKKRTFGADCPNCWDSVQRKRLISSCAQCFNTGKSGGFYPPVQTHMKIYASDETVTQTPQGRTEHNDVQFDYGNFPELSPGDLVVDHEGTRWHITERIQKRRRSQFITRQHGMLHQLPMNDICYRVPVNVSEEALKELVITPSYLTLLPTNCTSAIEHALDSRGL